MERLEKFGRAIWKRVSGRRRRREQSQDTDTDKENQKTSKKKQREKSPKKSEQKPWKTSQEVVFTTPAVAPMSRRVGKKAPTESSAEPVEVIFTAPDVRLKSGIKRGRPEESQKSERSTKVSVSPIPKKKESTPTKIEVPITVLGRSDIRSPNFVERDRTSDSEGYSTDASVLSSLPHLETFQQIGFIDDAGSMGYHSTSELSPFSPRFSPINPPASSVSPGLQTSTSLQAGLSQQSAAAARVPALIKEAQKSATLSSSYQYQPKIISISPKLIPKAKNQHYSSSGNLLKDGLHKDLLNLRSYHLPPITKAVTIDQIDRIRDPVDDFLRNNIYKTKVVTTVFESVKGGFEELIDDVEFEIDKWFGKSSILAVACEVHFSVPEDKRNRQLECRMKEKILAALRENNKRLLYLKGLGLGKLPIPLAESKTHENIMKDWDTNSVRGVYQRYYARLLPYVYPETPDMHSPFWKLQ